MDKIKIVIGGDFFPRSGLEQFANAEIEQLFSERIITLFKEADYSVCNLEGALTNHEQKIPKCGPSIKAPPETIGAIKRLGIDCVTLANNHVLDYGSQGYLDTCATLKANDILFFGAGENRQSINPYLQVTIKGKTFIFYGVSETVFNIPDEHTAGANLYDEYRVCNEIKTLRAQCDYLIVLYHGGVEYFQFPTAWVRTRFHRMADCGASIVIAQHTHCIGTQESYRGSYLLYGQGNFHFVQQNEQSVTQTGLLLEVDFAEEGYSVKPHLISMADNCARYDETQDLTSFHERNKRLEDGDIFVKEFSEYSEKWMIKWLLEFRGRRRLDRLLKRILSRQQFAAYLRRNYEDFKVLRMLEHVRGEEDVEVMQQGLNDFYNLPGYKSN